MRIIGRFSLSLNRLLRPRRFEWARENSSANLRQSLKTRVSTKKSYWDEGVTAEEMNDCIWLRPQVVADIGFAEWTTGGVLRHAEFVALREDKLPTAVRREVAR